MSNDGGFFLFNLFFKWDFFVNNFSTTDCESFDRNLDFQIGLLFGQCDNMIVYNWRSANCLVEP